MSRIAGSETEIAIRDFRHRYVPMAVTAAALLLALLPIVPATLWAPDFGFLMLITWRLLRPELWPAQAALGFGLAADLISGAPLGQSMLLWTLVFLAFDYADHLLGLRDYWLDWALAAAAILFHSAGSWYIAQLMGAKVGVLLMVPQIVSSILAYPIIARLVVRLDRWRLAR